MENSNSMIDLVPDGLLEEIFLVLPAESMHRCRSVSKKWKSILESKRFMERRMALQKNRRKILVAYHCDCERWPRLLPESRFDGDEEIVYLHFNTQRPSMTCDGLVCFPDQDWIHVLNPSTRQIRRFPTNINTNDKKWLFFIGARPWTHCSGIWSMGFGREKVTGSFKIVMIRCLSPGRVCAVLDVETGDWRKVPLPCYGGNWSLGNHSACVNGSIYWLYKNEDDKLLAFDLHREEFHEVSVPAMFLTRNTQIVNLEDRLAIAQSEQVGPDWILEILTMDAEEERWSKTYSITLPRTSDSLKKCKWIFRPLALSKQGNLVFYDNSNMLYKYYPGTDQIRCLSSHTRVMSPYLENLVPFPLKSSHHLLPVPLYPDADFGSISQRHSQPCPFSQPGSWKLKWKCFIFQIKERMTMAHLLVLLLLVLGNVFTNF